MDIFKNGIHPEQPAGQCMQVYPKACSIMFSLGVNEQAKHLYVKVA